MHGLARIAAGLGLAAVAAIAFAAEEHPVLQAPLTQAPGRQLSALTVTYAPGQSTPPHRHGADAFVYVLSGQIRSQVEGSPARVYGPGEGWFEPAGAHHLASGNASREQPATMLVVFVARPDAGMTAMDQPAVPARTQSR
jgi:quercetin dioxygenase-like cupin family protein